MMRNIDKPGARVLALNNSQRTKSELRSTKQISNLNDRMFKKEVPSFKIFGFSIVSDFEIRTSDLSD